MLLSTLDWCIIAAYLLLSLGIGLYYKNRAGKNLSEFFLGGRSLPWYILGLSMVATTFAADTPLAVAELIGKYGISGNWLWWNMLFGGMLTTFFFASYWRRAEVLTEAELIEFRYGGKPAAFLRGFKSVYLGLIMNCLIIAWVNVALKSILEVFFNIPPSEAMVFVFGAMALTAFYSSMSGFLGVAITDAVQFFIAMAGCIVLAFLVVNSEKIGGIDGLKSSLSDKPWALEFFPRLDFSDGIGAAKTLSLSLGSFLAFLSMWAFSWYPGAEPGGGGYVAQRIMSAKSERDSVFATLFFQVAHYCLRPWPWILVGLCAIVLYPDLPVNDLKKGYVLAMRDFLPSGFRGLLLVAFFAAYMSTIATQLNWGTSYVVNDLYKRFLKPENSFASNQIAEMHYVNISRFITVLIMLLGLAVSTRVESISGVWSFIMECGAGLGVVLMLRWYWWRINAWSEITATIAPFVFYALSHFVLKIEFPNSFFITVGGTTISWLLVTFFTKPESDVTLIKFYNQVRPDGWWGKWAKNSTHTVQKNNLLYLLVCWISAVAMTYSILFFTGKFIFKEWEPAAYWGVSALVFGFTLIKFVGKANIFNISEP
jgi:Na+/proline symporter